MGPHVLRVSAKSGGWIRLVAVEIRLAKSTNYRVNLRKLCGVDGAVKANFAKIARIGVRFA